MDYQKIHNDIINRAKLQNRKKRSGIYFEQHHIIPKCIGGLDNKENLVLLTAREHFIIHKLLCEIYPENENIFFAYRMLAIIKSPDHTREYEITSYEFERIRIKHVEYLKKITTSNPLWGKWNIGKVRSEDTKQKLREHNLGKKQTDEQRLKNSLAHQGSNNHFFEKTHSIETRKKMSEAKKNKPSNRTGAVLSEATRKKISESIKRSNQIKKDLHYGK